MRQLFFYSAKEILFWYTAPFVFLFAYISHFHSPIQAIPGHLLAITLIAISGFLFRLFIFKAFRKPKIALFLTALFYSAWLYLLSLYYLLVLIGLKSWGRVITEELIFSYAQQAQHLCEAIELPYTLAILLLITGYFMFFLLCFQLLRKNYFLTEAATPRIPSYLSNSLIFSLMLYSLYRFSVFIDYPGLTDKEPFHLTLYSGKPMATAQRFNRPVTILDQQEEATKTNYRVNPNLQYKNIILIIVDALRPDHMGLYGYARNTTPWLDSISNQGKLRAIRNVHSTCGESACGLTSISTSKYYHQLPNNPFTLQQVLQRHGYEINFILGGDHTRFYNLKEMYGQTDLYYDGSMAENFYLNDDRLVIDKVNNLPQWQGKPTMFQFHLMSAHPLGKRLPQFEQFSPHHNYTAANGSPQVKHTNHYDNGVIQTDAMIKQLFDKLQGKGYLKNALIIITADHGESLGEHQMFSHANSVREELLSIPLLLLNFNKLPAKESDLGHFYSQVDIAPTILHEIGINLPETWKGHPIQVLKPHAPSLDFTFFQLTPYIGLFDHRVPNHCWKYWTDTTNQEEFLFDMTTDPEENHNLIETIPDNFRSELRKIAYSTQFL